MRNPALTLHWRIIDGGALQFRCWDDEWVVYNTLTGDAHLLEAATVEILLALQRNPSDMLSLARFLADSWQCEMNEDFLEEIDRTLSDMRALSLVESR